MEEFDVPIEGVGVIFCSPEQLTLVFGTLSHHFRAVRGLLVDEVHLRFCWEFCNYAPSDHFSTYFPNAVIGIFSATLDQKKSEDVVPLTGMRNVAFFTDIKFPNLWKTKVGTSFAFEAFQATQISWWQC
jgi:hypothetical protein